MAHNLRKNECGIGDTVLIQETQSWAKQKTTRTGDWYKF